MIVRILLTVLLTFSMTGYLACSAVTSLARPSVCTSIIKEEKLAEKVYTALEKDFKEAYNTTAIPPETYMDAITTEWLEAEMCHHTELYMNYINGAESAVYEADFTALEESITAFFYDYAESIDYEPDDVFEEKLSETITNAEKKITQRMDAFYMQTLQANGILPKVQKYLPYVTGLSWGLWGVSIVLIGLLVVLEHGGGWRRIYWAGCGLFGAGALLTAPCAYILGTDAISGFAIKEPIVYTAITSLLEGALQWFMIKAIVFGAIGLLLIILSVILNKKQAKAE